MGATPQGKDITIEFHCQFRVKLPKCTFPSIMEGFTVLLPMLLADFFQKVLVAYAEDEMACKKKSFECKCGNATNFIWKTRRTMSLSVARPIPTASQYRQRTARRN